MKFKFTAVIIISAATILAIASFWNDSPVVDEIPHIGAGYSYVVQHSYQFNPEHPPLAKDLAGIALLTLPLNRSALGKTYQGNWPTDVNGEWNFGRAFIFNSGNDAITLVRTAKLPMLLFFILSGWIIFIWTKKLYGSTNSPQIGSWAGLLALFLFSFSPTIITHSRLVTTDMAALFGIILSTYFFVHYLQNQTKQNFWISVIAFGIAELTKFSTFLLIPYFVLIGIIWGYAYHHNIRSVFIGAWKSILVIVIGFIFVVGPIYQLHLINYSGQKQQADAKFALSTYGNRLFADPVIWASDKPILRPFAQYGLGLLMVFQRNAGGNQTYFIDKIYQYGIKSYFPVVYFIKEPLPFWVLFAFAVIGFLAYARPKEKVLHNWIKNHFTEIVLLLWIIIYWALSITAKVNIGIRHLIPVYGFTYILISGQLALIYEKIKFKKLYLSAVGLMCAWFLIETLMVFPYYLTYFNEVAGGPTGGHKYVVDSNLDWGQDLKRLGDWVETNNIQKISLDYFGWADQSYYLGNKFYWVVGGKYKTKDQFLADNPTGGYLAVSGTFYQQSIASDKNYYWLTNYQPVTVIGNSIFVWHIIP
jgi:4-amino-4-deoxy-L-arabinose transferase-like glycosyltransferase